MKVAIIGAGNVGKALGTSITRAGHDVVMSASSAKSAGSAAEEIGARAASDNVSAVREADLVVLAVPYVGAGEQVASEIADQTRGRVVIDATNPIKPDYSGLATEGTSGAEELQRRLPGAHVVKAFNTIFAANQSNPSRDIDGFVAGDDADAKQTVIGLVDAMGFTPVDVGSLSQARHLEGMAWVNIGLNSANGWSWSSAWRLENKG
jgi:8-hydroxy-5-deazaflavin:NADPH oxidoreductase